MRSPLWAAWALTAAAQYATAEDLGPTSTSIYSTSDTLPTSLVQPTSTTTPLRTENYGASTSKPSTVTTNQGLHGSITLSTGVTELMPRFSPDVVGDTSTGTSTISTVTTGTDKLRR
ncbi:hypothetical protein BDV12DRAFT_204055 [Aspergillus spectabilis]